MYTSEKEHRILDPPRLNLNGQQAPIIYKKTVRTTLYRPNTNSDGKKKCFVSSFRLIDEISRENQISREIEQYKKYQIHQKVDCTLLYKKKKKKRGEKIESLGCLVKHYSTNYFV